MTPRRSTTTGRFARNGRHEQIHQMIMSWASTMLLRLSTSDGQGFAIMVLADGGKLPPHCLIPRIEFSSRWDMAIQDWISNASAKMQRLVVMRYFLKAELSRYEKYIILQDAAKHVKI